MNPGSPDGQVVLGTTRNHIMVGSLQNKFEYVLHGHCSELWALAAHPTELGFATAGYDQHVMFWRAEDHKLLWKVNVEVCKLIHLFYFFFKLSPLSMVDEWVLSHFRS